ncbi:DNA-binding protein [Sphingomonas beigongshangi]|uniref:DNA-binding protein n=1 Tax=Sphingomonas beigongshangi TaxID=2782540 RepID=UPI001AEDCAF6|nr:DNA-binding protein [Sphingomonas beigongshangi]
MDNRPEPTDRFGREATSVDETFDTRTAAVYLGCSAAHLKKLRLAGGGPIYHRLFRRRGIVYSRRDIDEWRSSRRFGSTTEYPETLS